MPAKQLTAADIEYIVIHCSATQSKADIGVKDIDRWHRARGFAKVGYHFVIRRSGAVEEGRALHEIGAHAHGYNSQSIGICLVGGLSPNGQPEQNFSLDQYAALAELLFRLKGRYPNAEVLGHRDLHGVHKECPCFDVRTWYKETVNV